MTPSAWSAPTILGDNTNYAKDPYLAYMGPWGAGSLVSGKDYSQSLTVYPPVFPVGTAIEWKWPDPGAAGIRGFNKIDFGTYMGTTAPGAKVQPKQVKALTTLTVTVDLLVGGDTRGFNVITDLFLSSVPGNGSAQVCEIEVFHNASDSARAWFGTLTPLGTVSLSGRPWKVLKGGIDFIFAPADGSQYLAGAFDLKAALLWLVAQNQITGDAWFNGLSLGAEPVQGAGSLVYNAFSVSYT